MFPVKLLASSAAISARRSIPVATTGARFLTTKKTIDSKWADQQGIRAVGPDSTEAKAQRQGAPGAAALDKARNLGQQIKQDAKDVLKQGGHEIRSTAQSFKENASNNKAAKANVQNTYNQARNVGVGAQATAAYASKVGSTKIDQAKQTAHHTINRAANETAAKANQAQKTAQQVAGKTQQAAKHASREGAFKAQQAQNTVLSSAQQLAEKAQRGLNQVKNDAVEKLNQVQDSAQQLAAKAQQGVNQAVKGGAQKWNQAQNTAQQFISKTERQTGEAINSGQNKAGSAVEQTRAKVASSNSAAAVQENDINELIDEAEDKVRFTNKTGVADAALRSKNSQPGSQPRN